MSKFMLLVQKYSLMILFKMASSSLDNIWPEPDSQDLYWTNGGGTFHTETAGMTAAPLVAEFGSSTIDMV
jgi:hypothetical protein